MSDQPHVETSLGEAGAVPDIRKVEEVVSFSQSTPGLPSANDLDVVTAGKQVAAMAQEITDLKNQLGHADALSVRLNEQIINLRAELAGKTGQSELPLTPSTEVQ